jgi:hypothetical protein
MDCITIEGSAARAVSPEGHKSSMDVPALIARLSPQTMETLDVVLPAGIKNCSSRGRCTIWVHETAPATYSFKWIARDSQPYGPGTKYRQVRISLPYVVAFCVFAADDHGRLQLTTHNECFFRNKSLSDVAHDELCFPALLNCSKFKEEQGHPLAWICTQHLDLATLMKIQETPARLRASFRGLMECLLDTGFNLSSEEHEGSSWFTETVTRKVDPRIESIERWEKETAKDPMFVLDVPWISTGRTVKQMLDRIFQLCRASRATVANSDDIARIIHNNSSK